MTREDDEAGDAAMRPVVSAPPAHTRVLIATGFGGDRFSQRLEPAVAGALRERGVQVEVLLCDGVLPACASCREEDVAGSDDFLRCGPTAGQCQACFGVAADRYRANGVEVQRFGSYLERADREHASYVATTCPVEDIPGFRLHDLPVGGFAVAGTLDFLARPSLGRATLDLDPSVEPFLRRFLNAAILTSTAVVRFLASRHFDVVLSRHRSAVPQGLVLQACARQHARIVGWSTKFRKECAMFGEEGFGARLANEPPVMWENVALDATMEARLDAYFQRRACGVADWHARPFAPADDPSVARALASLRAGAPIIGLFPSLEWDWPASVPDAAFADVREWVVATIRYFARRPDLELLVRLHPHKAAVSRLAAAVIAEAFPTLPPNVTVVPGNDPVNSYALGERCNAVLIWASTLGLELAARGVPVVVAGDGWMRHKGFTIDATSKAAYFAVLDRLPFTQRLDGATIQRARRYAYHFFFRHMIPIDVAAEEVGQPDDGMRTALDVICDGLLAGTPFLYPL